MPSKRKKTEATGNGREFVIPPEPLHHVVKGPMTQGEVETVCRALKKAVIERAMGAEMSQHLGYEPGEARPLGQANHRNGTSGKTVLTDEGAVRIEVPRDREGSVEPQIVPKHERRFTGFDNKIIAMVARGMTVREIQSIPLSVLRLLPLSLRHFRQDRGARSIRPSPNPGGGPGRTSFRSSRFRRRCDA